MAQKGSSSAIRTVAVLLLCASILTESAAAAATVSVGGSSGWTLGYNYRTWAAMTRVKPSDSLFFKYDARLHNVLVVSKADYDACKTTTPWSKHTTGKDLIKFTNPGTYYLICGVGTHCKAGMKVAVTVRW